MKRKKYLVIALVVLVVAFTLAVLVDPAFADPAPTTTTGGKTPDQIGNGVTNMLGDVGRPLITGVAGVMGIPALVKRDWAHGFSLLGLSALVGSFLYAPGAIQSTLGHFAHAVFG